MPKGFNIQLTDNEDKMLVDFINYLGTSSAQTRQLFTRLYRTFVNDIRSDIVRLNSINNTSYPIDGIKSIYTQTEIDNWLARHEVNGVNNNCRYFLSKFMPFMGQSLSLKKIKYRESPKDKKIPTDIQLDNIFDEMKKLRYSNIDNAEAFLFFKIIFYCGLRKSECLKLRPMDFYIKDGFCQVLIIGKGNKQRWVILPMHVYSAVQNKIITENRHIDKPLFRSLSIKRADKVFSDACKRAAGVGIVNKNDINTEYVTIKKIRSKRKNSQGEEYIYEASIYKARFTIHRLRNYFATNKYKITKDLMKIKQLLGHSSITTTQIYIDPEEEKTLRDWGMIALKETYEDYKAKYESKTSEEILKLNMLHPDDYMNEIAIKITNSQDFIDKGKKND